MTVLPDAVTTSRGIASGWLARECTIAGSMAGVAGPFLIAAVREAQMNAGVAKNLVYDRTLYILAGLLLIGLIANLMVSPVKEEHHMTEEELARERSLQHEAPHVVANADQAARGSFGIMGVVAWAPAGIPFLIGVWIALSKAAALF